MGLVGGLGRVVRAKEGKTKRRSQGKFGDSGCTFGVSQAPRKGIQNPYLGIELYIQMGRYVHVSLNILDLVGLAVTFWLLFAVAIA